MWAPGSRLMGRQVGILGLLGGFEKHWPLPSVCLFLWCPGLRSISGLLGGGKEVSGRESRVCQQPFLGAAY